jgi:hypothetical protein
LTKKQTLNKITISKINLKKRNQFKMSAKKAAKKSRTSTKKSNNKSIMRWWYVLPVIAFVAVAGYAIVRFSEAATVITTIGPNSMRGSGKVFRKQNGVTVKFVDGSVNYVMGGNTVQKGRKICADMQLTAQGGIPASATLKVEAFGDIPPFYRKQGKPANYWGQQGVTGGKNGTTRRFACVSPIFEGTFSKGVNITITKTSNKGAVGVENIKLFRN